jgi:glycerate dehydrogenase
MKIVVLDGYTLNPGDLSWEELEELGDCEIYDRTAPGDTVSRAAEAEIILTNKVVLSRDVIAKLPKLRYIGVLATGCNVVDTAAAKERGIPVTNVPTYGTASVAQMTFAHILNLTQRVGDHSQSTRGGDWSKSADFCYWNHPLVELDGLTIGIIGFGRIGRAVASIARSFGMKVLAYDAAAPVESGDAEPAEVDDIFRQSDVVTLHCPLTPQTEGLVNAERLSMMKSTAFLINTGRGPLVDEHALADALNSGVITGAGVDVLSKEPPDGANPLLHARDCYVTPHIAWAAEASRQRLMDTAIANIRAFIDGNPQNTVN